MKPLTEDRRQLAAEWVSFAQAVAGRFARRVPGLDFEEMRAVAMASAVYAAAQHDPARWPTLEPLLLAVLRTELRREMCRQLARGLGGIGSAMANGRAGFEDAPRVRGKTPDRRDRPLTNVDAKLDAERLIRFAPVEYRPAIVRWVMAGESQEEVAAGLGVDPRRVSRMANDGLEKIRKTLRLRGGLEV